MSTLTSNLHLFLSLSFTHTRKKDPLLSKVLMTMLVVLPKPLMNANYPCILQRADMKQLLSICKITNITGKAIQLQLKSLLV